MNSQSEALFYDAIIMICAVMTLINVSRQAKRGASAYLLGGAFLVLGASVYAYTLHAPQFVLILGGIVVFLLLAADMVYRISRESRK